MGCSTPLIPYSSSNHRHSMMGYMKMAASPVASLILHCTINCHSRWRQEACPGLPSASWSLLLLTPDGLEPPAQPRGSEQPLRHLLCITSSCSRAASSQSAVAESLSSPTRRSHDTGFCPSELKSSDGLGSDIEDDSGPGLQQPQGLAQASSPACGPGHAPRTSMLENHHAASRWPLWAGNQHAPWPSLSFEYLRRAWAGPVLFQNQPYTE